MESARQPRILLVDDQPVNIQSISRVLADQYELLVATTGQKALEIAKSAELLDLIILDINMPEMDGYEVCRLLKEDERTRSVPVIFVTGLSDAIDEARGFSLGASDYITKPFHSLVVRARVRNQINLKLRTDLLEAIAHTDALTGVYNRRTHDENYIKLWRNCVRNKQSISVLMIDIDYFKVYNDTYGHGAGDECLRRVAQALARALNRPLEYLARYGGEEFVAVLPETDKNGAFHVAARFLEAVRGLGMEHSGSSVAPYVTVSVGGAAVADASAGDAAALAAAADAALYRAKQGGRNQVVL